MHFGGNLNSNVSMPYDWVKALRKTDCDDPDIASRLFRGSFEER